MDARTFNNYCSRINEVWAANVTGIPRNNEMGGIDLLDAERNIGMEIKFSLDYRGWTVVDRQLAYQDQLERAYWGLGVYKLSTPIASIKTHDLRQIEDLVVEREFWVVPWEWMHQFPIHKTAGKTEKSEWQLNLAYPKHDRLPPTVKSFKRGKTTINITEGVNGIFTGWKPCQKA